MTKVSIRVGAGGVVAALEMGLRASVGADLVVVMVSWSNKSAWVRLRHRSPGHWLGQCDARGACKWHVAGT